jgi:ankyrin repeat protein
MRQAWNARCRRQPNKPLHSMQEQVSVSPEEERRYAELQALALDYARTGETESLLPMLRAGLPVNLADHKANSLLMLAAYHGHAETVSVLLEYGAEVDRRNDRNQTPLGGVAFKGYTRIARLLVEHGADLNADNGNGMTPLLFASMFGRTETADYLRSAGGTHGKRTITGRLARVLGFLIRLVRKSFF